MAAMVASTSLATTTSKLQDDRRQGGAAKRGAARKKRWHQGGLPLSGVGLHHLLSLSDRDWRRWPRLGHRELNDSGVMVFTAEDFESDGKERTGVADVCASSGCSSRDDDELSEDWEDPLWVKDENVRTEGRCQWWAPPQQVVREEREECVELDKVKGGQQEKNERNGTNEREKEEDDGMGEVEHLVSSNELSWIIGRDRKRSQEMGAVIELEEQEADEGRERPPAGSGVYERGAEYLLQKYFCSLPTFPTRASGRTRIEHHPATTDTYDEELPATKRGDIKKSDEGERKVMVPRIEGLSPGEGEEKAGRKHRPKLQTDKKIPHHPEEAAAGTAPGKEESKLAKGGRNLVNFLNLSPRRPGQVKSKRRSFFVRRSVAEEPEAAGLEDRETEPEALPKPPHQREPHQQEEEEGAEKEWNQVLKKPRRKRSISIPLSSYKLELELSLKSSSSSTSSSTGDSASGGKGASLARRLRRKEATDGVRREQPTTAAHEKEERRNAQRKFNTISSLTHFMKHDAHEKA